MAASHNLAQSFDCGKSRISKTGVLTLYGYGVRVIMQAGHLEIEDGIGPARRKFRLPRVAHGLKRLVCISEDGFITLAALKWLTDTGASFIMLDPLGKVRLVTGPTSPSESRLRRAQALALGNGTALRIARELISAKLTGQEALVREKLKDSNTADLITELRKRLATAENVDAVRAIESRAAAEYWSAWRDLPVLFPRKDVSLVPAHWLTFGPRHSPVTGGARLSVTPPNSLLNYVNEVAASECRLAASACGLDPGIGFLHTDTANRDSLGLDLIETIRPAIESWLLNWLTLEPLRRLDFFETPNGNCRISSALCSKLSETAPTWRKLVAPWAEHVVRELWATTRKSRGNQTLPATRLTQQRKREAKGNTFSPVTRSPKIPHVCRGCGAHANPRHEYCKKCRIALSTEALIQGAKVGRILAHSAKARISRIATKRRHDAARRAWIESGHPSIGEEIYQKQIQPRLTALTVSAISTALQVSTVYASHVRCGRRIPHARHWLALQQLTTGRRWHGSGQQVTLETRRFY